jgi:hypothetical protein
VSNPYESPKSMYSWRGEYSYDGCFEPFLEGGHKVVSFEFSFRRRPLGFITGEIRDGHGGIPEPAVVWGRLTADKSMWFFKSYPHTWATHPESGVPEIFDRRKHVVDYEGVFENPAFISGTWKIRAHRRSLNGIEYELRQVTGKWSAISQS